MYLKKGEHLMWIAETASHRPFQDHELSISRHVPEREHTEPTSRPAEESPAVGLGEGDLQPITPIARSNRGYGEDTHSCSRIYPPTL